MKHRSLTNAFLVSAFAAACLLPAEAEACGGFFCSTAQPVNQAAERIVFADNGDGTVTAVIQIMYQGPSQNFSWLLPISTVPQGDDIAVASNIAFQRLQSATNPQYSLTTRVEGTCDDDDGDFGGFPTTGAGGATGAPGDASGGRGGSGVMVEASGTVGSFDWNVISFAPDLEDPAEAAVAWLGENGYDVPDGARALLGPYLADGLFLLALKLTKGADSGSIRPIVLTYAADRPMIPIKLTAVAANADMGVMTWLLSNGRGVPQNYLSLELNEARINWFNANANYNSVVIDAANEAEGRGFVTEYATETSSLGQVIWTTFDDQQWTAFNSGNYANLSSLFNSSLQWASWDGFWDAVRETVTLTNGAPIEDLQRCSNCYPDQLQFSPSAYIAALEEQVIAPVRDMQALFDRHSYVTRLYTTMSAAEMTVDPLFTFNPDLADVSNIHTAERVIECSPDITQFEAPWRVELPQGVTVRGTAEDALSGNWPGVNVAQPSNFRILQLSDSGGGAVMEDNSRDIRNILREDNAARGLGSSGGGCAIAAGARPMWALGAFALAAAGAGLALRRRRAPR